MSSHREAPEISKDPVADNTDLYAFVSPDQPDTVTIVANYIPLQLPQGGPNFFEFGDDVEYQIHISNRGKSESDIIYKFNFRTTIRNANTFLYNVGPITSVGSANWNRPQYYSVVKSERYKNDVTLGTNLTVPPCNVGPRSTGTLGTGKTYEQLYMAQSTHGLGGGRTVFAGQRADAFFVDLGSIFDLGVLRPFQHLHLIPSADAMGVNGTQGVNVHSIVLQVPITELTRGHKTPSSVDDPASVIGVWASASRPKARIFDDNTKKWVSQGPLQQVSRLGNPLFNEVVVPMAEKDEWNASAPNADANYVKYVVKPELAGLLPVLYPGVFPNLAAYKKSRTDLAAALLTGVPSGIVPGFQNFTGPVPADMLRLNVAIPPTDPGSASKYGLLGGDPAGFPNGRRLSDDIVAIELRAVAGALLPLVDPSYTPDAAAGVLQDSTNSLATNVVPLDSFPYMPTPLGGYQTMPGTSSP